MDSREGLLKPAESGGLLYLSATDRYDAHSETIGVDGHQSQPEGSALRPGRRSSSMSIAESGKVASQLLVNQEVQEARVLAASSEVSLVARGEPRDVGFAADIDGREASDLRPASARRVKRNVEVPRSI